MPREKYSFIGQTDSVASISVSSDGKYIVSASEEMQVKIWNIKKLREEVTVDFGMGPLKPAVLSPDGRYIATLSLKNVIKVHKCGEIRRTYESAITKARNYSRDGSLF